MTHALIITIYNQSDNDIYIYIYIEFDLNLVNIINIIIHAKIIWLQAWSRMGKGQLNANLKMIIHAKISAN